MPDISKINALAIGSVSKVDGLAKASISTIDGVAVPSAALLLDTYTGSAAAYSVRLLRTAYTGSCMRVREDGGNTETDIGFDGSGGVDQSAIASHCGANNGFIRWWYDQSGNAVDAGQATAGSQPQIYNGTAVITENGKPALDFDGINDALNATVSISNTEISSNFVVVQGDVVSAGNYRILDHKSGSVFRNMSIVDDQFNIYATSSLVAGTAVVNTQYLMEAYYKTNDGEIYVDNSSVGTAATWTQTTVSDLQLSKTTNGLNGTIQEAIIWATDQRVSNRSGIATNINGYFSIY